MTTALTDENIREIAEARAPRYGLDVEEVIEHAYGFTTIRNPPKTAVEAVQWALTDLKHKWTNEP